MEREGIAVVGTCIVDKIKEIDRYPAAGELTNGSSIISIVPSQIALIFYVLYTPMLTRVGFLPISEITQAIMTDVCSWPMVRSVRAQSSSVL